MADYDLTREDWYPVTDCYPVRPAHKSNCSPRSRITVPSKVFRVHYIGAGKYAHRTDDAAILMGIEVNHARPNKKPNEYNSGSGRSGILCEYAGIWQAAHASGHNWEWGHLVFMGDEVPSEEQADRLIDGVLHSRRTLVAMGLLTADHSVEPHTEVAKRGHQCPTMPHSLSGTPCPGALWTNKVWWSRLSAPLSTIDPDPEPEPAPPNVPPPAPEPEPEPEPEPPEEPEVAIEKIVEPTFARAKTDNLPYLVFYDNGMVRASNAGDPPADTPMPDETQYLDITDQFGIRNTPRP